MLACARIGAIHSVVFGGFSAEALADRINDAEAKLVITADAGWRRGTQVDLKGNVDEALKKTPSVEKCLVVRRTGAKVDIRKAATSGGMSWSPRKAPIARLRSSTPSIRSSRSIPPGPPGSPRACCIPPAVI